MRLSPPFELESIEGSVHDFRVKSTGAFAFYQADERQRGVVELFTVPALGGSRFRENRILLPDRAVLAFEPTPVGNFVVFVADQDADDVFELYSRTIGDAAPRKLSGTMTASGDVRVFTITSDGARVVFAADKDSDEVVELYGVPVDGSASAVKLSGVLVAGGDVADTFGDGPVFRTSADGRVVFLADKSTDEVYELYSAPLDGSVAPVRLNGNLAPGGDVWVTPGFLEPFQLSADGATVVYRADQAADELFELFRAPVDGSAGAVRIHPVLAADRDAGAFRISPDSERVVYTADQTTNDVLETYSVPLDGSGAPVRISNAGQPASVLVISPDSSRAVLAGGTVIYGAVLDGSAPAVALDTSTHQFRDVTISPDSERVVYRLTIPGGQNGHTVDCDQHVELRSAPLDGSSAAVRIEDPAGSLSETCPWNEEELAEVPFLISPNSNRVYYRWSSQGPPGLAWAPIAGGAQVMLTTDSVGPHFALDPGGTRIFFQADTTGGAHFDFFSASAATGAARVKLNGNLAHDTFADVGSFRADSSGELAVFTTDSDVDGELHLYSTPVAGGGPRRRLTSSGSVSDFQISADRELVLYRRGATPGVFPKDLYSVRTDGSAAAVQLNGPLPAGKSVSFYGISADGTRAVYSVGASLAQPFTVHSVPLAGGASPTLLSSNATHWFTLGASSRLVFVRGYSTPTDRMFSVPIAGGSAPLELAPGLGGYIGQIRMTPDGSRIVFKAGNVNVEPSRIYSTAVDGSAGPVLLSGTLQSLSGAKLSPDGAWAIFSSLPSGELYSARVDGSLGPVSLSGPMVAGGAVPDDSSGPLAFVSPDSSRVVYLADQETDGVVELYSVPIDGSAAPVELNAPLPSGGDVQANHLGGLEISPDGTRVVYAADQDEDGVLELYVVPIDGSAPPLVLSAPMGADTDLDIVPERAFRISPDSRLVVYATEVSNPAYFNNLRGHELFLVPIDRALEPVKLTGALANSGYPISSANPDGGVEGFEITADSRRVLYAATVRTQVLELFSAVLSLEPKRGHVGVPGGDKP